MQGYFWKNSWTCITRDGYSVVDVDGNENQEAFVTPLSKGGVRLRFTHSNILFTSSGCLSLPPNTRQDWLSPRYSFRSRISDGAEALTRISKLCKAPIFSGITLCSAGIQSIVPCNPKDCQGVYALVGRVV